MKYFKTLLWAVSLLSAVCCAPEDEIKSFPVIDNLASSVWESRTEDKSGKIYYHVMSFESESQGSLTEYDTANLELPLATYTFTYTFPLNDRWGMILRFDEGASQGKMEGKRYDGYLIQKGNILIDFKDAYVIQLFEVDDEGNQILDDKGNPISTMTFWKE